MSPTFEAPESIADVVGALREGGLAMAGGTHVMPRLNARAHDIERVVSLRRARISGIDVADGSAIVGAGTTLSQLGADDRLAFLRPVVESIASPSIRNLATVGGNLFVQQPYGDLAVCLLALEAVVEVTGPDGPARVAVQEVLRDGVPAAHVATSVCIPVPAAGTWFYTKAMRRRMNSAAIVTVAAVVNVRDGVVEGGCIALGGAGARPVRAAAAERALVGGPLDREHVEAAAAAAAHDAEPFTDAYASAWYRRRVLPVHVRRALLGE